MTKINPTRRTVVRTAAWSVPAVAVVAGAPQFAASHGGPDLRTSTQGAGSGRTAPNELTIQPATLNNTGDTETGGLTVSFNSSVTAINNLTLGGIDPGAIGATVTGLGTNDVTMVLVPTGLAAGTNIAPGASYTSPLSQNLTFSGPELTELTVVVTATNGGHPWTPPTTPVPPL